MYVTMMATQYKATLHSLPAAQIIMDTTHNAGKEKEDKLESSLDLMEKMTLKYTGAVTDNRIPAALNGPSNTGLTKHPICFNCNRPGQTIGTCWGKGGRKEEMRQNSLTVKC